nr:DEAD/DEAH box helicase family protein [uncultured Lachnoclostridium sp.]
MKKKKEYVSDVITSEVIDTLTRGGNYLIGSEMASGKNYWVRNVLLPYAIANDRRTLILSHRTSNKLQQEEYLKEYKWECIHQFRGGLFNTMTYQTFQNQIKRKDPSLKGYDYIICDEAHYFISDASFNPKTEIAFDFLDRNEMAIKIFMSGTYQCLEYLPFTRPLEVLKEANYYNNNVESLNKYDKQETIGAIILDELKKDKKVLAFHGSKNDMLDYDYGNSAMIHSGNKDNSKDFIQIIEECKFDSDVLNTTKLLTEGVELKKANVEIIVINNVTDLNAFIQAPARVRDNNVKVFYRVSRRSLLMNLKNVEKQLEYYQEYVRLGSVEFVEEYGHDVIHKRMKAFYLDTIIDGISGDKHIELVVSKTGLACLNWQRDCYTRILEFGFEDTIKEYFPDVPMYDLEMLQQEEYIRLDVIDNFVDRRIFKEDREELVNIISNRFGITRSNGSRKLGMKTINSFFEENNIEYKIESDVDKSRKSPHYKKTYWILKATA